MGHNDLNPPSLLPLKCGLWSKIPQNISLSFMTRFIILLVFLAEYHGEKRGFS